MAPYDVSFSENPRFGYNMLAKPSQGILRSPPRCTSSACSSARRPQSSRRVTFASYESVPPAFYYDALRPFPAPSNVTPHGNSAEQAAPPARLMKQKRSRRHERLHSPPPPVRKQPSSSSRRASRRNSSPHARERRASSPKRREPSRKESARRRSSRRRRDDGAPRERDDHERDDREHDDDDLKVRRRHQSKDKDPTHCRKCATKLAEQRRAGEGRGEREARRPPARQRRPSKT